MNGTRIGVVLLGLIGLGITYVGISFFVDPVGRTLAYAGSALVDPAAVAGTAKGVRDLVSGIAIAVLLISRQWRAAGWFAIVAALIPFGDMLVVLLEHGSVVIALSVHGATAAVAVLAGVLLLRGSARSARSARSSGSPDVPARPAPVAS
jgi:hypothetical protein